MEKQTREKLKVILEKRKEQRALFMELLKPLDDDISLLNDVLRNKKDIKIFLHHTKIISKYYGDLMDKWK